MLPRSIILCILVLALAPAPACGAARIGELEVKEGNAGVPCFTISQAEEQRGGPPDFHSISVTEAGPGARGTLWSMTLPRARTFAVTFRMCIPYAGRLPVLPQTPAADLQPGKIYEVTMEARGPAAASAPRSYRTRFCLVRQEGRAPRVRNIGAGNADAKQRRACGG